MNATGRVYGSQCHTIYNTIENEWKCIFGNYRMGLVNLPHFINNAQYDAYSLAYNLGNNYNINTYTEQEYEYGENPFRSTFRQIILSKMYGNYESNIFSSACFWHCTSEQSNFWNISFNGQSFASTLGIFIDSIVNVYDVDNSLVVNDNTNNKWVENCTENYINCGHGCISFVDQQDTCVQRYHFALVTVLCHLLFVARGMVFLI